MQKERAPVHLKIKRNAVRSVLIRMFSTTFVGVDVLGDPQ